jgi:hypothetical protein
LIAITAGTHKHQTGSAAIVVAQRTQKNALARIIRETPDRGVLVDEVGAQVLAAVL